VGIFLDLKKEDTPFRVPLTNCYLRVTNTVPDLGNKSAKISVAVWLSKESRTQEGAALPIGAVLDLTVLPNMQERRLEVPRDASGNLVFNGTVDGKPAVIPQEIPEIPPFADVLDDIVAKLGEGPDKYKDVGYALVKLLPFVQERNPRDDV